MKLLEAFAARIDLRIRDVHVRCQPHVCPGYHSTLSVVASSVAVHLPSVVLRCCMFRFEEPSPLCGFALGLIVQSIDLISSVGGTTPPAFSETTTAASILKDLSVQGASIYCNCASHHDNPAVPSADSAADFGAHQPLLNQFQILVYARKTKAGKTLPDDPHAEINVVVPELSARLDQNQLKSIVILCTYLSHPELDNCLQHRPSTHVAADPVAWWLYAYRCIQEIRRPRCNWSWPYIQRNQYLRRQYLRLQQLKLCSPTESLSMDHQILFESIEVELGLPQVTLYRSIASKMSSDTAGPTAAGLRSDGPRIPTRSENGNKDIKDGKAFDTDSLDLKTQKGQKGHPSDMVPSHQALQQQMPLSQQVGRTDLHLLQQGPPTASTDVDLASGWPKVYFSLSVPSLQAEFLNSTSAMGGPITSPYYHKRQFASPSPSEATPQVSFAQLHASALRFSCRASSDGYVADLSLQHLLLINSTGDPDGIPLVVHPVQQPIPQSLVSCSQIRCSLPSDGHRDLLSVTIQGALDSAAPIHLDVHLQPLAVLMDGFWFQNWASFAIFPFPRMSMSDATVPETKEQIDRPSKGIPLAINVQAEGLNVVFFKSNCPDGRVLGLHSPLLTVVNPPPSDLQRGHMPPGLTQGDASCFQHLKITAHDMSAYTSGLWHMRSILPPEIKQLSLGSLGSHSVPPELHMPPCLPILNGVTIPLWVSLSMSPANTALPMVNVACAVGDGEACFSLHKILCLMRLAGCIYYMIKDIQEKLAHATYHSSGYVEHSGPPQQAMQPRWVVGVAVGTAETLKELQAVPGHDSPDPQTCFQQHATYLTLDGAPPKLPCAVVRKSCLIEILLNTRRLVVYKSASKNVMELVLELNDLVDVYGVSIPAGRWVIVLDIPQGTALPMRVVLFPCSLGQASHILHTLRALISHSSAISLAEPSACHSPHMDPMPCALNNPCQGEMASTTYNQPQHIEGCTVPDLTPAFVSVTIIIYNAYIHFADSLGDLPFATLWGTDLYLRIGVTDDGFHIDVNAGDLCAWDQCGDGSNQWLQSRRQEGALPGFECECAVDVSQPSSECSLVSCQTDDHLQFPFPSPLCPHPGPTFSSSGVPGSDPPHDFMQWRNAEQMALGSTLGSARAPWFGLRPINVQIVVLDYNSENLSSKTPDIWIKVDIDTPAQMVLCNSLLRTVEWFWDVINIVRSYSNSISICKPAASDGQRKKVDFMMQINVSQVFLSHAWSFHGSVFRVSPLTACFIGISADDGGWGGSFSTVLCRSCSACQYCC